MSDRHEMLVLRVDGAARGNPGPASAGIVIERPDGAVLVRVGRLLGRATNNEAEYAALLEALDEAKKLGASQVDVCTDSELLARQLQGRYRVRAANLRPLFARAKRLLAGFSRAEVTHVPREKNRDADRIANLALDSMTDIHETPDP